MIQIQTRVSEELLATMSTQQLYVIGAIHRCTAADNALEADTHPAGAWHWYRERGMLQAIALYDYTEAVRTAWLAVGATGKPMDVVRLCMNADCGLNPTRVLAEAERTWVQVEDHSLVAALYERLVADPSLLPPETRFEKERPSSWRKCITPEGVVAMRRGRRVIARTRFARDGRTLPQLAVTGLGGTSFHATVDGAIADMAARLAKVR